MIEIEKQKFREKFSEMNIRQRMFEGSSIVTFQIETEFFFFLVDNKIIKGLVDIKLDSKDIHDLNSLEDKTFTGDIGHVTISVNNNGIWEYQSIDIFQLSFGKKNGPQIQYTLDTDICHIQANTHIVSLYTTSSSKDTLKENFDMDDFYEICIEKQIGKNKICKYFVKEENEL